MKMARVACCRARGELEPGIIQKAEKQKGCTMRRLDGQRLHGMREMPL